MNKNWLIKDPDPQQQNQLSNELNVHPIVAQLLINRNIIDVDEARTFLSPSPDNLHDPFLMKDMDKAVERIKQAQSTGEKVLIFGDYDVDGVTSSAVLRRVFKKMHLNVINYIPHRVDEGYGLNADIAEFAKDQDVKLIVTVDCGINAFDEVDAINALGIDVIIIDHHTPDGDRLPKAIAVVDPKREDCQYPFKHLAAVGLAGKFAQALSGKFPLEDLDLITIGTIADVVKLRGENRIFARFGLNKVAKTQKPGLRALLDVAKIGGKPMKPHYIGFVLGPRLNAAGRMDSATVALDMLLAENYQEAHALAQVLEAHNQDRQKMQRDVVDEAIAIIEGEASEDPIIVVHKAGWHKGVVGIVASRIVEKFNKPSIVISSVEGVGVGSARSRNGFHLYDALAHCSDYLEAFGGHKMAAGLTVKEENIPAFVKAINQFARNAGEVTDDLPTLDIDAQITLSDIDLDLVETVNSLHPYGEGNPEPLLCLKNVFVKSRPQVLGRNTLKLWVTDGAISISAVGFGMGDVADNIKIGDTINVAFHLSIDDWNKAPTPQLMIKDIQLS